MKIAFDIDYTLIDEFDKPKYEVIDLFRWFEKQGWDMIIWSGGGVDYAEMWVRKLGLKATIVPKCSMKVDIVVDDEMDEGALDKELNKIAKIIIKVK
ncbi:hypothetical protein KAW50_03600 [candidate division WOR-3 bacterium]|nr:hypothetical protein [candidate division WOR-3 bacterium]